MSIRSLLVGLLIACAGDARPVLPHRTPALRPPAAALDVAPFDAADGELLARKLPRMQYRGGLFIRHPRIVTITFANDDRDLVARLSRFGSEITRSSWWHTVVDGYCSRPNDCIGDGGLAPAVQLDDVLPAELRDTDVDALLRRAAKAGQLGAIDDSAVLLVYLPSGIRLADATTRYCEGQARAYHRSLELGGVRVAYAVLPRCGAQAQLTGSASHEILEATTNPFPAQHGFAFGTGSDAAGFGAAGLEPVDPCGLTTMDDHWTTEGSFVVHRAWSNRAAALGHDPCVPARADRPYAMLVPRMPAVRLAHVGDTVKVELDASTADRDAKRWSISAFDLSGYQHHATYVDVTLDKSTVVSGDTVKLSIKALELNPAQHEIVALVSTVGVHSHMWPLLVMMR